MWGRYGNDRLNQFLMICAMVFLVLSMIFRGFFYLGAVALMVYAYFRMFSHNTERRAAENQWYLSREMKVKGFFRKKKKEFGQRKEYRINAPTVNKSSGCPKAGGELPSAAENAGTSLSGGVESTDHVWVHYHQ